MGVYLKSQESKVKYAVPIQVSVHEQRDNISDNREVRNIWCNT